MNVFAVVVTYNSMRWCSRCLGSLYSSYTPIETIIVDNASSDNTTDFIKKKYPKATVLENTNNLGFAKANNIGIRYAIEHEADYILLLNQDAWVEKDTLKTLLQTFNENDNVGIASPIHLNGSYSGLDFGFASYIGEDFASDAYMQTLKSYYDRPFVNAAAWLMSSRCIETVGGFDTLLFRHYGEDTNYCQRVLYHGFRIMINTQCTICHDREERKVYDEKYVNNTKNIPFFYERCQYGNINIPYDIKKLVSDTRKKIVKKIISGKFHAAQILKEKIQCLEMIEKSRKINIQKGLNWL